MRLKTAWLCPIGLALGRLVAVFLLLVAIEVCVVGLDFMLIVRGERAYKVHVSPV
jgi:hypothetical protein